MLLDYTNFFDFHSSENEIKMKANYDFNVLTAEFLNSINCNPYYIRSICNALFSSMTSDKCYYHTPIHILSIISNLVKYDIKLQDWEKLSLLFHDAIYRPGSKKNEVNSIQFMLSLLDDTGVSESLKNSAAMGIQVTAMHLEESIDPEYNNIMDLDLLGLSADKKSFDIQNECIKKEFYSETLQRYDGISLDKYNINRKSFFTALKNKKSIYRGDFFIKHFEELAQNNINGILKISS
jgi:predicted metal-dependent HD superfamily phosphohydrolase